MYIKGYMLCYIIVNSVISFKKFYIRRILDKIWQIIPKFAKKKYSVYPFVYSQKINVHLQAIIQTVYLAYMVAGSYRQLVNTICRGFQVRKPPLNL